MKLNNEQCNPNLSLLYFVFQGAAGIQTEVDALGYWQKDNPNQTFKMEPESVDILYSTTHMTKGTRDQLVTHIRGVRKSVFFNLYNLNAAIVILGQVLRDLRIRIRYYFYSS